MLICVVGVANVNWIGLKTGLIFCRIAAGKTLGTTRISVFKSKESPENACASWNGSGIPTGGCVQLEGGTIIQCL